MNELNISDNEKKLRVLDHRDRLVRGFEVIVLSIVVVLTLFSLSRIANIAIQNQKNAQIQYQQIEDNASKNRARLDVGLCIISVSPTVRTPAYVKSCYDEVEKQYGIKVQRFGDGEISTFILDR